MRGQQQQHSSNDVLDGMSTFTTTPASTGPMFMFWVIVEGLAVHARLLGTANARQPPFKNAAVCSETQMVSLL
jgi:hypothetical protein